MANTINVDYHELTRIKNNIAHIAIEAIALTDPLQQSLGLATNTEREIIDLLMQICKNDIPRLMEETTKLLEVIPRSFQDAENAITSIINGATNAIDNSGTSTTEPPTKGVAGIAGSVGVAAAISEVTK